MNTNDSSDATSGRRDPHRVVITDIDVPLSSIVAVLVKMVIAVLSISALLAALYFFVVFVWMIVARPFA